MRVISARFAPFPPSSERMSAEPSAKSWTQASAIERLPDSLERGPAPFLHELSAAGGALLDRQAADVDHRAAEPAVELLRGVQPLVDLPQTRVPCAGPGGDRPHAPAADLREPLRLDREP